MPARDVLKDGLSDLVAMNQHVMATFNTAVERFKANQGVNELSMKSGMTSQHSGSVKKPEKLNLSFRQKCTLEASLSIFEYAHLSSSSWNTV